MALRCWPGCAAYVERSAVPDNVGAVVEVVALDDRWGDAGFGPVWSVRYGRPMKTALVTNRGELIGLEMPRRTDSCLPDAWLRPITPPPGSEAETTEDVIEAARGVPVEG